MGVELWGSYASDAAQKWGNPTSMPFRGRGPRFSDRSPHPTPSLLLEYNRPTTLATGPQALE